MEQLGQVDVDHTQRQVVTVSQDSFYRELTPAERAKAEKGQFNFDHPGLFSSPYPNAHCFVECSAFL